MFSVTVLYEGKRKTVKAKEKHNIRDVLESAGINPETVIVRRGNEIIPDTEKVRDRDKLEALKIVSGG